MRRNRIHFRLAITITSFCFAGLLRPAPGQGRVFWEEGGVELCDGTANTGQSVVSDSRDGAIVIWSDSRGNLSSVYAQRVNREGEIVWPRNGVLLRNNLGATGFLPAVADGHGGAVAVWPDAGGYPFLSQLTAQRVDSAGAVLWGELGVTIVGTNEDREFLPALVSDGRGGAIVAWTMFNQSGANDSLFACRLNKRGDVVWTTLVRSDTLDFAPSVCGDGRGGIVVAWHEMQAGRWLVMLQLFDSTGVAQWGPTGVRALETSSSHTTGSLLRQRPGGMVVGCFAREQHGWRIRAQMLNLAGNRLWSPAGVAVSPEYSAVACMRTVEGGGTHTLWLWTGLVLDTYKLYAQRLDSIGSRQWDTLGVYVGSTRDATPWRFEAAPDGRGGAIPVWLVHMDGQNWDIRTQRVDAQGGLCWGDTGLVVIGDTNVQRWTPSVIPDAGGGAILGWEDYRYGPPSRTSVYAQRVGDASALCGRRDAKGAARTVTAITTNKEVTYTRSNCGPGSSLLVYGCAGVLIRRVAIPAAASAVSWDCRDGSGVSVPAGTYFLVEEHAGLPSICRVTLLPAW